MAGSTVDILLDGLLVGTVTSGSDGAFAAFLSLPAAETPRILTLATKANGTLVTSDQQVIIAPVQRAEVAVAADTTATQSAQTQAASTEAVAQASAASAPAVLLSDSTGLRVLQPATAADPTRTGGVVLDVISYTSLGDVLLQGRATASADVLIYLDNAAVTSTPVDADGIWSIGLPGVAPGIYTLRLDEVDKTGKVLSRIETPFKREDRDEVAAIAAASAPTASAPADTGTTDTATTQAVTTDASASATAEEVASASAPAPAPATVRVVTVQPGNTLWAIARESYGDGPLFVKVFEANRDRIRNPDLIYPGQIFEIPE
jgi:nucleoid-associated protein YgaU